MTEQAFTFTEAQLGEDDDMSQNVSIINSNNNVYASEVGYLFSPVRFATAHSTRSTTTCSSTACR